MTHGPVHLDRQAFIAHQVAVTGHQLPIDGHPRPSLVLRFHDEDGQPLTVVLVTTEAGLGQLDVDLGNAITDAGDNARFADSILAATTSSEHRAPNEQP